MAPTTDIHFMPDAISNRRPMRCPPRVRATGGARIGGVWTVLGVALSMLSPAMVKPTAIAAAQPAETPTAPEASNAPAEAGAVAGDEAGAPAVSGAESRPVTAGRVAALFDFEERAFNAEPVPRNWFRAQNDPPRRERPGYPNWNRAAFDHRQGRSGSSSVYLPVNGGSTSMRLAGSVIPIFPNADYVVTCAVRTDELRHARAVVRARFLDAMSQPIDGAEFVSEPALSPGQWTTLHVALPSHAGAGEARLLSPDAARPVPAFLQVDLEVLQPEQLSDNARLRQHEVWPQDLSGGAWFDDVAVFQMPRLEISARGGRSIVVAPEPVVFSAEVRDLTGQTMTARLRVVDMDGRVVASEDRTLGVGGGVFDWTPTLPSLGWYRATIEVLADSALVGQASASAVWIDSWGQEDLPAGVRRDRTFGVEAGELSPEAQVLLPGLLRSAGMGSVSVPVDLERMLSSSRNPSDAAAPGVRLNERTATVQRLGTTGAMLDRMLRDGMDITAVLPRIPNALARELRLDPSQPQELLDAATSAWLPLVQPLLDTYGHGQRISRWQLGASVGELDAASAGMDRTQRRLGIFRGVLNKSVPGPVLVQAWRAELPVLGAEIAGPKSNAGRVKRGDRPPPPVPNVRVLDALSVRVPASFSSGSIGELAERIMSEPAVSGSTLAAQPAERTIVLELPSVEQYGERAAVVELARRTVRWWQALEPALAAGQGRVPPRLMIARPWRETGVSRRVLSPGPELAVWANLARRLSGQTVVGTIDTIPGVTALVLAPARRQSTDLTTARATGTIVAWNETAQGDRAVVRGYFAPADSVLTLVDIFGNRRVLSPIDEGGQFEIPVGDIPVFIEGVDAELAQFALGFSVDPAFVPAVSAVHGHSIVLRNPWPVRISGEVSLPPQQGAANRRAWTFSPTSPMPFTIAPGGTTRLPFSFAFNASEEAGERRLSAIVRLNADREYPPMRLGAPITIGLADLDMQVTAALGPRIDGPDVIVTATVTNTGTTARTLQVDFAPPDLPRQQQPISNLAPGESAVRRFVLPRAAVALSGRRLRVTLSDVDGPERLNRFAEVP